MKRLLIFLAILSGVALVWAAPPADKLPPLIGPPEALARITTVVVGGSPPSSGPAPGTLLLGTNSLTGLTELQVNPNVAYSYCHTGQATASVANAYYYDNIGAETDPVHVCIWNSSGTLLGCSGAITMTGSAGWRTVAWSGPSIVTGTSYFIGFVTGTSTGAWALVDQSSPSLPMTADFTVMTYGSEGNLGDGDYESCTHAYGNIAIYVTN